MVLVVQEGTDVRNVRLQAETRNARRVRRVATLGIEEWREWNSAAPWPRQLTRLLGLEANHAPTHLFGEREPDTIVVQRDWLYRIRGLERHVLLLLPPLFGVLDVSLPGLRKLLFELDDEVFDIALGDG